MDSLSLPAIDITAASAPEEIRDACKDTGFFYVVEHGVDEALLTRLEELSREFFAKESSEPGKDVVIVDDKDQRWDRTSVHDFQGTYGDYLINKVRVFPELRRNML